MKKNNKGFTLIELLAVIVILSIILVIATTSVIKNINDSKDKTKYIAAKEIVQVAEAYMATKSVDASNCINVETMINDGYIEADVTNPETGKNISNVSELSKHKVCLRNGIVAQHDYKLSNDMYKFDGYVYVINKPYYNGSKPIKDVFDVKENAVSGKTTIKDNYLQNANCSNNNTCKTFIKSKEKISMTEYNKMIIKIENVYGWDIRATVEFGVGDCSDNTYEKCINNLESSGKVVYFPKKTEKTIEVDLSSVKDEKDIFLFYTQSQKYNIKLIINDISFE